MRGVAVKCPECNAALEAGVESREHRCSYCGTLLLIQRRTRFLQRPQPLPSRPPEAPPAKVATEGAKASGYIGVAVFLILSVGLPVGLPIILCNLDWSKPYGQAMLADVDGDGAKDLICVLRHRDSEALKVAAYAAKTGKRLWRSDELRRGTTGTLCSSGDAVIEGNKGAALNGLNLADGEIRWRIRLGESVARLCATNDPQTLRVELSDKKAHLLSLSDGSLRLATIESTCTPVRCARYFDHRRARDLEHRERKRWEATLKGMKVEKALTEGATTLALGYKTPGTSVPMIASVRPRRAPAGAPEARAGDYTGGHGAAGAPKVLWQTAVPAQDPLRVAGGAPDAHDIALDERAVAIAYCLNDSSTHRLTVFSLADGRRRFDVALPEEQRAVSAVLITPHLVIVTSSWGMTAAFDVSSGEEVYTID